MTTKSPSGYHYFVHDGMTRSDTIQAWIVVYGAPRHQNATTIPGIIFVRRNHRSIDPCPQDQIRLVSYRHEIGHTRAEQHSANRLSVMHNPAPCWPTD